MHCSIRLTSIGLLLLCPTLAKAAAPERCLSVSQDGRAQFSSVQAVIDSLPSDNRSPVTIAIAPGVYRDIVRVPRGKRFVTLRGEDAARTILSLDNAATKKRPDGTLFGTSGSASTYVEADDFSARGLCFENTSAPRSQVRQALALSVSGDRCAFYNCRFLSWQDTLYTGGRGRQFFQNCAIEGDVDFIFGSSSALFQSCRIHSRAPGYITAHARTSASEPTGYVFHFCDLTGDAPPGTVFLGRPWRPRGPFARVAFLGCRLGAHIRAGAGTTGATGRARTRFRGSSPARALCSGRRERRRLHPALPGRRGRQAHGHGLVRPAPREHIRTG